MGGTLLKVVWRLMPTTALLCLVSLCVYLGYRFQCLIEAQRNIAKDPQSLGMAWFFFVIELLTLLPNTLPYTLRALALKMPARKKDVLVGDEVPSVDILITCCNEDLDVILDTARAACVLDYPADRYRVFVCDDGGSPTVKAAILEMRDTYPHIYYTARVKGPVKDYKAGNLNHGLKYSRMTPRFYPQSYSPIMEKPEATMQTNVRESVCPPLHSPGFTDWLRRKLPMNDNVNCSEDSLLNTKPKALYEIHEMSSCSSMQSSVKSVNYDNARTDGAGSTISEYVAGLDADMIPEPQWLRTMMPHLMDEPKMALVCPPQTFYDLPVNDPLTQTMSHFAGITEVVNDALGHADCLGSGYVARRTALESINGFPVESLSEDVCCSATMLGAGWKTGFVHETLQYGSVPESFFAHVKQRTRWFVGHVQTAFLFNFRLWGHRGRHLTILQRLAGMAFDLRQIVQIPIAFSYISIPFALLSGYPMVIWTSQDQLVWLIRLVTIWMLCHWSHQGTMGLLAGIGNGWYDPRAPSYDAELEQWMGPYILSAFFRSFILPKRFGGRATGFTASGSITSSLQERSAANRAPFVRRAYVTLIHHRVMIHVLFVMACVAGVVLCIGRVVSKGAIPGAYDVLIVSNLDQFVYVVTRIGWPPLLWLQNVISAMGPILYLLNPPTTPDREDLLERDPKTGVAHPKEEYRVQLRKDGWSAWRYARNCLAVVYTLVLIGLSTWLAGS